mgnify:CR=1 FL=1
MIFLVEDDENIRELVVYTLNTTGLHAQGFGTPSAFWAEMKNTKPELILLDIMLPEETGLSILEKLRNNKETKKVPVIMLTAKGSEIDKVRGFDLGADDYIPKPFGMMELVARVKAVLRRTQNDAIQTADSYNVANLFVSVAKHKVKVDDETVELTKKEFDMLCYLLENKNIVLTRDQLLNHIWGYSFDGESRTVDVHIRTLRQKLGSAGNVIETIRGVGYRISDEN